VDQTFLADIERLSVDIEKAYNSFKLRQASALVMQLATLGNVYFDQKKPWVLIKELETKPQLITTLTCCMHCLKVLALVSSPIIPTAAGEIWEMLGIPKALDKVNFRDEVEIINSDQMKLKKPKILFSKVEDSVIEKELAQLEKIELAPVEQKLEPLKELITFDDFQKLDLRVGKILEAEKVPKSKKLLKLRIDIGFEERTIVSGIATSFPDLASLIGQKAIIVANLKPAKLMGIESQGMLLSAGETILELPKLDSSSLGSSVR